MTSHQGILRESVANELQGWFDGETPRELIDRLTAILTRAEAADARAAGRREGIEDAAKVCGSPPADGLALENIRLRTAVNDLSAGYEAFARRIEELTGRDPRLPNRAAVPGGWRTIDSAPNEGRVLVVGGSQYKEAEVVTADGDWWRRQKGHLHSIPTHWMPRPAPPPLPDIPSWEPDTKEPS